MSNQTLESRYPELRALHARARLSFLVFLFALFFFGLLPFLGPDGLHHFNASYGYVLVAIFPLGFFWAWLKASRAARLIERTAPLMPAAESRTVEIALHMANFTMRNGRGFSYRIAFSGESAIERGAAESPEFVMNFGYREKGGAEIGVLEGKRLFRHRMVFQPRYRQVALVVTGLFAPGAERPFMLMGPDGLRIWLSAPAATSPAGARAKTQLNPN